ncbi:uncharacterized protein [Anabrus simplex]|uniref:uncharacterized protein n=1 Tax=Anabrus simplex TaxID=316456 RepID=UPI0035A347E8
MMACAFHLLTSAVLWTLIHFCSSELYDVTTIYRFDKPHEIRDTPISEVQLPNIKDWFNSGWIETDSIKAFAHLPTEDRKILHTSQSNYLTEAVPLSWDRPFVLSTPERLVTDEYRYSQETDEYHTIRKKERVVYVIFMPTKEIQFGDLVMLRMDSKSLSLNICNFLEGGTHYFILNDRQCRSIKNVADTSEPKHYYFHRVTDGIVVSSPSNENKDGYFMTIPISYVKDKHYLRMGGPHNEIFSSTIPKRVLALSTAMGRLETELDITTPSILCLEMTYLMRNYTGSKIELLLNDGYSNTDITVGVVNGVENKGEWSTHRFLTGLLEPGYPYKLAVEAHNEFGKTPIYLHELQACTEYGHWNATTYPISGREEIHALTNAIGRQFRLHNESIVGPVDRSTAATYPSPDMNFPWLLDGWNCNVSREEIVDSSPKKYIRKQIATIKNPAQPSYSVLTEYRTKLMLRVDNVRRFEYIAVYILASSSFLDPNGFMITFNGQQLAIYSTKVDYSRYCDFPVIGSRQCTLISYEKVNYYTSHGRRREYLDAFEITIHVRETYISAEVSSISFSTVRCDSHISWLGDESKVYYSIATRNMPLGNITVYNEERYILRLESDEGKLVSPAVSPVNNQLCLAIVYNMEPNTTLAISAVRDDGKEFPLKTIHSKRISGWKEEIIKRDYGIFNNDLPVQFVVRGTREGASDLVVQELSVCDWNEDVMVLKQEAMLTVINSGVDVFENDTKHVFNDGVSVSCMNGGVLTANGKCACPPGFMGPVCEQGCGPNRYGTDCSGRCSASKEECRGMVLCRPNTGCDCAPGYRGYFCSQNCSVNWFGVGCRQQCGYCRFGTCDQYTGECRGGCAPGYFPPLCQEKCSFLLFAPEVVRYEGGITVTVNFTSSNVAGKGLPHYYQIQYKLPESTWIPMRSDLIDIKNPVVTVSISNLRVNDFQVRAVIINKDGTTYQGDSIPVTEVRHECLVPVPADYQLKSDLIGQDSFRLAWKVPPKKPNWCPVAHYEVFIKEDWSWVPYGNTENSTMHIGQRSPGEKYVVRVRAVTTSGQQADFSEPLTVRVAGWPLEQVRNLKMVSAESTTLTVSWDYRKPEVDGVQHYVVTYECLELISCPNELCNSSSGHVQTKDFNITLQGLKPHAQYLVTVAPYGDTIGPSTDLLAITLPAGSQVIASMEDESVFEQTNTSFSVRWAAPRNCSSLNGFFQGYHYRLRIRGEYMVLAEASTVQTSAEFTNLTPLTHYDVEVFVMTNGGWDEKYPLIIPASTGATTPERVTELTVYKTARRVLGLRWGAPARTYGTLKAFIVTYHETQKQLKATTLELKPIPCPAWPYLYCHSISRLRPDTQYTITVRARNVEVDQGGEVEEIEAITREGAPSVPPYIQVVSQSNSSLSVKWGIPNMINGILRSFLVSVEEVDTYNASDCCQYFPMQEMTVTEEQNSYHLEVSGLRPASNYIVSVSAKTVMLGPPANISVFTRPPTPHLPTAPIVTLNEDQEILVLLKPVTNLQELIQRYLLLLTTDLPDEEVPDVPLWDLEFAEELKASLNRSFYLVAEFTQEEMIESVLQGELIDGSLKVIQWNHSSGDGVFGHVSVPSPSEEVTYTVVLVAVLDYQGVHSFSYRESEPFMVSNE